MPVTFFVVVGETNVDGRRVSPRRGHDEGVTANAHCFYCWCGNAGLIGVGVGVRSRMKLVPFAALVFLVTVGVGPSAALDDASLTPAWTSASQAEKDA